MTEELQPCTEDVNIVLIGESTLEETERFLLGCQTCSRNATLTLDYILDALTGCDPVLTEYLMARTLRCPSCHREIREKTFVVV